MAHSPAKPNQTEAFPEEAFRNHIGILGKTGTTAKGFAESLIDAGRRVCVVDPTGVWWDLRLLANGHTPAYPVVIFGGPHADLDISEFSGARLAEIIAAEAFSSIIDTSGVTVGARTRFFTEFAEALHRVNSRPLHLIIDEAHLFAPQGRVPEPQSGRMVHAANNLVSGGRARGLRVMLISQRPAKLHKDSLTQVETLIALRLIAPQDRAAVEDWIGEWADPKQGRLRNRHPA
jgi:DNA helicase HerA-like ATPase